MPPGLDGACGIRGPWWSLKGGGINTILGPLLLLGETLGISCGVERKGEAVGKLPGLFSYLAAYIWKLHE